MPDQRSWGWHPLTDTWARRIVDASPVGPGDLVLDLGAGLGALTRPLLDAGADVLAFELHPGRLAALRRLEHPRLRVVRADVRDLRLPRRPFRVVASPPYDGASAVLDRLLSPGSRLLTADLVVQRQLARRYAERPHRRYDLEVVQRLPRSAFRRPPTVDSVVLRVSRPGPGGGRAG